MKKLLEKDKKLRYKLKQTENKTFILKAIFKNSNLFILIRWKAFSNLKRLLNKKSQVCFINKCLFGINKKRFSKLTFFSRNIFLKLIRSGSIPNLEKSSW